MKTKLISVMIILALALLSGCGAANDARSGENKEILEAFQKIKGMEAYLDELSEMDYAGIVEIKVKDKNDIVYIYNTFIAQYKGRKVTAGWNNGALSTFLSFCPGLAVKASVQEGHSTYNLNYDELVDYGDYDLYVFTALDTDISYKRGKEIDIIIEKGTETSDNPHIFIYQFERIISIGRTDMMLPSTDKAYMSITELGAQIPEDGLDIEWYGHSPE